MNKLKNKKGFFPLWLGMQEAICGVKPKTNLNPDQETDGDQLPDLGLLVCFVLFLSIISLSFQLN
jgi:hypothetical protein